MWLFPEPLHFFFSLSLVGVYQHAHYIQCSLAFQEEDRYSLSASL